jgi:hypothetical protein
VNEAANANGCVKVYIFREEYGYEVSPSPIVVPRPDGAICFVNLSGEPVKVIIEGKNHHLRQERDLDTEQPALVKLPDDTDRVIPYRVEITRSGLLARGHSAPIIIRDP